MRIVIFPSATPSRLHHPLSRLAVDLREVTVAAVLYETGRHKHKVPDYRGSGAPGLWEMRDGCATQTVTVHRVVEQVDAGAVLRERTFHTKTHFNCGSADYVTLVAETADSKRELEAELGHAVEVFAFPMGKPDNISPLAYQIAFEPLLPVSLPTIVSPHQDSPAVGAGSP